MSRIAALLSSVLLAAVFAVACGTDSDTPVAVVNGEEILQSEWQDRVARMEVSYEMQGIELDDETRDSIGSQVLDELITHRVLVQHAVQEGFAPDAASVEAEYQQIEAQFPGEDEFNEALAAEGFTPETLREILADDLAIQGYIEAELAAVQVEVTEAEVEALYAEYQASFGEEMLPLEEVRGLLVDELERQGQGAALEQVVQDLRDASDIQILI